MTTTNVARATATGVALYHRGALYGTRVCGSGRFVVGGKNNKSVSPNIYGLFIRYF